MTNRELVLDTLRRSGKLIAQNLQNNAEKMNGTEIYAEEDYLPAFDAACRKRNMLDRPVGFVCRSAAGRAVKLVQPYDSTIYTAQPEELPAQWGFYWSTDPAKALPFIAVSTSPYNKGDCCLNKAGEPKRSNIDSNVWPPDDAPQYWDDPE